MDVTGGVGLSVPVENVVEGVGEGACWATVGRIFCWRQMTQRTPLPDDAHWTLFDFANMRDELKVVFWRKVDLVIRRGIESSRKATAVNPESLECVYGA